MLTGEAMINPDGYQVSNDLATLSLAMEDGSRFDLAAEQLRMFCKCAHCSRAHLDGRFPDRFPGIAIIGVTNLGYGLNISFSDGHNRGIYPTNYLRSLANS